MTQAMLLLPTGVNSQLELSDVPKSSEIRDGDFRL